MDVFPSGTQYRAFVLLEYSDEEAIKILNESYEKRLELFMQNFVLITHLKN